MRPRALVAWGGWEGHEPEQGAAPDAPVVES